MMYYVITIINVYGSIASIGFLIILIKNYFLPQRIETYVFLTIASMLYVFFANVYSLSLPARDWKLPITSLLWFSKTLYFSWAIRYKGIRKK